MKKLWPPLVTPDYTPFISQIGDFDGVFNGFTGSNPRASSCKHTTTLA